ncbi:MAG: hypothetical protein ABSC92_07975 [Rhizomicrobium sp.]
MSAIFFWGETAQAINHVIADSDRFKRVTGHQARGRLSERFVFKRVATNSKDEADFFFAGWGFARRFPNLAFSA